MAYVRPPTWNDGDVVYAADLENVYDGIDSKADTIHSHASTQITDATVTGRALLTAATATAARTAISAAPALGSNDNYVTDAEKTALHSHANKTALDAVSGTNTGDQTLPTWTTLAGKPAVVAAGADAAAARTAIGAGTSNLALGTTASTAKAGNYSPPAASATAQGIVELATTAEATTGTDTTRAVTPAGAKAVVDALSIPDSPDDIGAAPATQAINAQTAAYTLIAADAGKLVTLTLTAAADLTVPANVFTAGQRVDIADRGTARVTVLAGSGMTVNPPAGGSLVMEGRYAYASLVFISATEADLVGLVAAP